MVFGKKESIFDLDQNKQLQQLMKNQKVLISNNDYFIKTIRVLSENNTYLINHIKSLESTILKMQVKDEEFAKMFSGLASLSQAKAETEATT